MKMIKYIVLAVLLAPFGTQAANIDGGFTPLNSGTFEIGDTVSIDIWGSWDEQLFAGVFAVKYDENALSWTGTSSSGIAGVLNSGELNSGGAVEGVGVGFGLPFGGYSPGTYTVATVSFQALVGGIHDINLAAMSVADQTIYGYRTNKWYAFNGASKEEHFPTFDVTGTVTVNPVPLPAAAWFMLSGLGFLAFRRKRTA